jgi:hypothetical protein
MPILELTKGTVGLIVFLAATGAALLQLQMRHKIPPLFRGKPAVLLNWHRWLGRTALVAFVMNASSCLISGSYYEALFLPRYLIHGIVAVIAAAIFCVKLISSRRRIKWGVRNALQLGVSLWAAQVLIFGLITVHALVTALGL